MTVHDLFEVSQYSTIRVKSGYDGRVLCYRYSPDKHPHIGERKIINIDAGLDTQRFAQSVTTQSYVCVTVDGHEEYEKTHKS